LHASFPQAFDFPALEGKTGFEAVFDEVVMTGFLVQGNGAGRTLFAGFLLAHGRSITTSSRQEPVGMPADRHG
jgi:hypothetical protein